ncbi:hypothetical protein N7494_007754 [Penicillium frequentans]|uniref:Glycosyltransferase family 28 N-terminal domain-containing protein n=1 Tax=Penicillium frequentans TaxID=3151616 RepID=A0AAD6CTQ3_9EURO|nr:hypothetical protein N7494_007754 [Penicillium glabrum]
MSEKEVLRQLDDDRLTDDDFENDELPPTYSSLFTDAPLPPPIMHNELHELAAFEDNGRFSIDLSAGSRTSAILQGYSLPTQRPQMIEIVTKPPKVPDNEGSGGDGEIPDETNGMRLDIILMLVGSRDDVKSCILVGQGLSRHGHRVRVATHSIFHTLVKKAGLEFFSVSNDPEHPMAKIDSAFMPRLANAKKAEVMKNNKILIDTLKACWIACTHPGLWKDRPFFADAIIATPLAHAHIHCAERLSIPLHIMSTTPWTPTREFANPLAQIQVDDCIDRDMQNYFSFLLIEESLWHEISHVVDHFRQGILGLPGVPTGGGALLRQLNIPHTYLWSSDFLPKPADWNDTIDVSGYVNQESQSTFMPSDELVHFLESTPAPIFVSLDITLLGNSERFVRYLREASDRYGFAFLLPSSFHPVSGISESSKIFVLDNVPTDWLIPRVSIVFTHGNVPTISTAIRHGKPMVSFPLLRDQPFWSSAIHRSCIGPEPIQENDCSTEILVDAVRYCMRPETREAAQRISLQIQQENALENAVSSFHSHLNWDNFRCCVTKTDPAIYQMRTRPSIKLSAVAVAILMRVKAMRISGLELIKRQTYNTESEQEVQEEELSAFDEVKSVSKNLMKAIVKPTVSHISDAYKWREGNDTANTTNGKVKIEKRKGDIAIKVAKTIGFSSAVFCGKIAALPFKTVYYMGETASYGVRSLKGIENHGSSPSKPTGQEGERTSQESNPASIEDLETSRRAVDGRLVELINMLQRKRGAGDKRLMDAEFSRMVVSNFEIICQSPVQ